MILDTEERALTYARKAIPQLGPTAAEPLQGGYCNFVYRVRCSTAASSVVLKSYPPFVATNPSMAFSTDRCLVELTALSLAPLLQGGGGAGGVRMPGLIHADPGACCLIMEDAGEHLVSLTDCLTRTSSAPKSADDHDEDEDEYDGGALPASQLLAGWPEMTAELFAGQLRSFLADVSQHGGEPAFENRAAWAVLGGYLQGVAHAHKDARLSAWVARAPPVAPPPADVRTLILGDLWPNSVLFNPETRTVWLLDWEMARRGEAARDAEQLMDNLWVMLQNPAKYRSEAVQELLAQLQRAYIGDAGRDWRRGRAAEFVRSAAGLCSFPHWELSDVPAVMRRAMQEVEEFS